MTRLGQSNLLLRHCLVGTIWIRDVVADHAFQPRPLLNAGCQVQEMTSRQPPQKDLAGFKIINLGGQLRWGSGTGPVIGDLSFPKNLEHFQSAAYPSEHLFTICCDVPHQVLNRLEAERSGKTPILWMDLCGSSNINGDIEPIYLRPWQFTVPTEMWDLFLADSGYHDFDVIELRRVLRDGSLLGPAIAYLGIARRLVSSEPTAAVAQCRYVIEAIDRALKDRGNQKALSYLTAFTDERRGKEYSRVLSVIKQLGSLAHHDYGRDSRFTREESIAVVRLCEVLLVLLGELPRADDWIPTDTEDS